MGVDFRTSGYIEVYLDGVLVSRHRQEREAIESILNKGNGVFEIRHPVTKVTVNNGGFLTVTGEISGNP
jgi:hypothetical protein